ncbi:MAG TPA: pyroglutamyl-peptidase I [Bacillales bacterium]|nr:pyroglutamyl-peptidase I [Bacillales bacterium]
MANLLLTGFEGFLKFSENPTEWIVQELDGTEIGDFHVHGRVLPVDFQRSSDELFRYEKEVSPEIVLSLGLAAGRNHITPERVAINCNDGAVDNKGNQPQDRRIVEDGPDAYFSTLPIRRLVNALKSEEMPANISNTAGTYLCNNVMYSMLHQIHIENRKTRSGFVHIPASHRLAMDQPSLPSWPQDALKNAVQIIIKELSKE